MFLFTFLIFKCKADKLYLENHPEMPMCNIRVFGFLILISWKFRSGLNESYNRMFLVHFDGSYF